MNVKCYGKNMNRRCYPHSLVQWFDERGENVVKLAFERPLRVDDRFTYDDCTYQVEYAEPGKAVVRMIRQRIPDTSTTVVHKCPNRKMSIEKMDKNDIMVLKEELGEKTFKQHKKGRVKMNHHNKVSLRCPHCNVVFWKKNNLVPEPVEVEVEMPNIENEEYQGGLEKEDLDKQVKDGTWLE